MKTSQEGLIALKQKPITTAMVNSFLLDIAKFYKG
jgi:hypothetical protein